jgi:hypothetical protein
MRQRADFQHRGTDCDSRSGGKVFLAEVHVDEELIAGETPTIFVLRDKIRNPRVHDVDLHLRVWTTVGGFGTSASAPTIADQSSHRIEFRFFENLALVDSRPPHDQLDHAIVFGRFA